MNARALTEAVQGRVVTRHFAPAATPARPARAVARQRVAIGYWVHDRGHGMRRLAGDPAATRAASPMKLFLNATSIFVVFLIAGLAAAATAPVLAGYGSVVVTSGSMEPSIKVADVVLTTSTDGEGLERGTVIDYELDGGTRLHRITATIGAAYRTAGDANPSADSELVSPSQVRGVGAVVVPFVGAPRIWLSDGRWLHLGAALVVLVAAMYMSRTGWIEDDLAKLAVEVTR